VIRVDAQRDRVAVAVVEALGIVTTRTFGIVAGVFAASE
jgi:hypothetical protein